jgi:hypothetical protein
MDITAIIGLASAATSVSAASISIWQAQSAKRQAAAAHGEIDPTFHLMRSRSDGMAPWRFILVMNNFNRRAIDLLEVRIEIAGFTVYRDDINNKETIRSIASSVSQGRGPVRFDFRRSGYVLAGVSPNSAKPSELGLAFGFGPTPDMDSVPDFVPMKIDIDWTYADEDRTRSAGLKKRFATGPSELN